MYVATSPLLQSLVRAWMDVRVRSRVRALVSYVSVLPPPPVREGSQIVIVRGWSSYVEVVDGLCT